MELFLTASWLGLGYLLTAAGPVAYQLVERKLIHSTWFSPCTDCALHVILFYSFLPLKLKGSPRAGRDVVCATFFLPAYIYGYMLIQCPTACRHLHTDFRDGTLHFSVIC